MFLTNTLHSNLKWSIQRRKVAVFRFYRAVKNVQSNLEEKKSKIINSKRWRITREIE